MASDAQLLQDSLVEALRRAPMLIGAEERLHSAQPQAKGAGLATDLSRLLAADLPIAEIDRRQFRSLDSQTIDRFREAMQRAVAAGADLAQAETQILESFGMTKVGELTSSIQTHLGGSAEVPDHTLAIYVPSGDTEGDQGFHEALQRDLEALGSMLEDQVAATSDVPEVASVPMDPSADRVAVTGADAAPEAAPLPGHTVTITSRGKGPGKLNPIPMLTAALEAIGSDGKDFGFVLRFGRYAPQGRASQFLVGGLGLADLSRRLTGWLEAKGPLEGQVQVIDEGSGELTVYLLLPEAV